MFFLYEKDYHLIESRLNGCLTLPVRWEKDCRDSTQNMAVFMSMHNLYYCMVRGGGTRNTVVFIFDINVLLAATREYHGTFRSPSSASRTKMAPAETADGVPRKARKQWHYRAGFALKVTICQNNLTPPLWWCRQVRRQRTHWHVYLQLQICRERGKRTTVRY